MAKRILLADDSVTIQKVVELTFMDQDYEVTALGNGDAAIESLAVSRPDLVIADVHMPGADGYAVCRRAKATYAGIPVLLLVGTFEPFDEADIAACGADGYLRKPFDSTVLLSEAERLLAAAPVAEPVAADAAPPEAASWDEPLADEPPADHEVAVDEGFDVLPEASWGEVAEEPEAELEPVAPAAMYQGEVLGAAFEVVEEVEGSGSFAEETREHSAWLEPLAATAPAGAAMAVAAIDADFGAGEPEPPEHADVDDSASGGAPTNGSAEEELVERIARRVVELMSERIVREVAWDVIPDLAEVVIRERIHQLEAELET
jgi:CheY-like chemotaxis protein